MLWVRYYVIPIDTKMEVENEDIIISTEYRGGLVMHEWTNDGYKGGIVNCRQIMPTLLISGSLEWEKTRM